MKVAAAATIHGMIVASAETVVETILRTATVQQPPETLQEMIRESNVDLVRTCAGEAIARVSDLSVTALSLAELRL